MESLKARKNERVGRKKRRMAKNGSRRRRKGKVFI